MSNFPDVARLQPAPDSLNVILKNTHFKDNLLDAGSAIRFRVEYVMDVPVLIFNFPEPYYDFLQILNPEMFHSSNQEWLSKDRICIKLVMSDPVITDHLTSREFFLNENESKKLGNQPTLEKQISGKRFEEVEDYVYSNINKFLV